MLPPRTTTPSSTHTQPYPRLNRTARLLTGTVSPLPPPNLILDFCEHFDQSQARAAPDRVATLAKNLMRYGSRMGLGVRLLLLMLTRHVLTPTFE